MSDLRGRLEASLPTAYQLERELGSGGMAVVYLAQDLRHKRRVALKVLRPEISAVIGPERFLREIETLANLTHPHILPLHDSGEADGLLYYVMPYVDGESLRDRLLREKQLPLDDALRIAREVADVLSHAHGRGVVHRDIKPENILLSGGHALVADFGIAAAIDVAGGSRLTETGIAMGTPAYMSPEQALGERSIGARSDIYALGCVLFEMLAGEPPFSGPTPQSVVARVLTEKPQRLRILRESVPEHIDATIGQALAKLPADRFSNAGEFTAALTVARPNAQTAVTEVAAAQLWKLRPRPLVPWAISAVALLSLAIVLMSGGDRLGRNAEPARFEVVLPDSAPLAGGIALSPNGLQLVYVGGAGVTTRLYRRGLNDPEVRPIAGTEGASTPRFSPDGTWIMFVAANRLMKVPSTGGEPSIITDSVFTPFTAGDREIVFSRVPGNLWRLSVNGGSPTQLALPDTSRNHLWYYLPEILPGGKAALITLYKGTIAPSGQELGIVKLPGGKVVELGIPGSNPRYVPAGFILFSKGNAVMAVPFSPRSLRVTGSIETVIEAGVVDPYWRTSISIAQNGSLAYVTADRSKSRLARVDRRGGASLLASEPQLFRTPSIAADGRRIALAIGGSQGDDIWTYSLDSRTLTRMTDDGISLSPAWFDDARGIAYLSSVRAQRVVKWQPSDRSGVPEVLLRSPQSVFSFGLGPPKSYVAFTQRHSGGFDIWIAQRDSPLVARPFLATARYNEILPRISPNGQLLAYVSNETGRAEVYITPLTGPGARKKVSEGGGTEPVWSPSGTELFYRGPTHFYSATIAAAPGLSVGRAQALFEDVYERAAQGDFWGANYDVFPDGNEFLMIRAEPAAKQKLFWVINWFEELRRQMTSQ